MAYVWDLPTVNSHNRRKKVCAGTHARTHGRRFGTCPNQEVVYGMGFYALDKEPVVLQVRDFGDRFRDQARFLPHGGSLPDRLSLDGYHGDYGKENDEQEGSVFTGQEGREKTDDALIVHNRKLEWTNWRLT